MNLNLSKKQEEILNFLNNYISQNGFPPSIREIGKNVGLSSPASVHSYLKQLEELNLIKHTSNKFRSIKVIKKDNKNKIPLIDNINFINNTKKYLELPFIIDNPKCYAYKCINDIFDFKTNDYLIIINQKKYKNKDIILYSLNDKLKLDKYENIKEKKDIIGKVICSINKLF